MASIHISSNTGDKKSHTQGTLAWKQRANFVRVWLIQHGRRDVVTRVREQWSNFATNKSGYDHADYGISECLSILEAEYPEAAASLRLELSERYGQGWLKNE